MSKFVPKGWSLVGPVGQDWSSRRYWRLEKKSLFGKKPAILMDCSAGNDPGHSLSDFIRIDKFLRENGLKVPQIYESFESTGYLLIEDFGDKTFRQAIEDVNKATASFEKNTPQQEQQLPFGESIYYGAAVKALQKMAAMKGTISLPSYYESHVHEGRRRVIDWYVPAMTEQTNPRGLVEQYLAAWNEIEQGLPPVPQGFVHGDFHIDNLMARKGRDSDICGILDFQGAMIGPLPYDLANLLEDARTDVAPAIRDYMLKQYCTGMSESERRNFMLWYRVLATQFHCRVIGQAIKLAVTRDNTRLLDFIPRLQNYIVEGLKDPVLAPLKIFFEENDIVFNRTLRADMHRLGSLVSDDAF